MSKINLKSNPFIFSLIELTNSSGAIPLIYVIATAVLDSSPNITVSNLRLGFFNFLLISATLSTISSLNPSLGPFNTASVSGILIPLLGKFLASQYIISSNLS